MRLALFREFAVALPLVAATTAAHADLLISSNPTKNVTCSGGVCTSTLNSGTLNVSDLQNMLASGNVKIVSKGTGRQPGDIKITAALTWVSSNTLTLDSYHSITAARPMTVAGSGGLTLSTNDGGSGGGLSFDNKGKITFWSLSSNLTINGDVYTLVNNIATLSSDIVANASGHYALAANYDASKDGTYAEAVLGSFSGMFEGLGNSISNLTIVESFKNQFVGLFTEINSSGVVENLGLINAQITAGTGADVGALVGRSDGTILGVSVNGNIVSGSSSSLGALAGESNGTVINSHSSATVHGCCRPGGLVGVNGGVIRGSYATGAVTGGGAGGLVDINDGTIDTSYATGPVKGRESGGLVGSNGATIRNSYATGKVTSNGKGAILGGLVGTNEGFPNGTITASYSTGKVVGGLDSIVGGFVGEDDSTSGSITNSYWDITTSGIANSSQGAGNISNDPGITGLTTVQLQAGLPTGFDPSIWAESATINSGLPYLLDIPSP